jgi:DNA polymerase-3 subunit beta
VSEETKSRGLKLVIENNKLQLLANSASKGSAIEELDVDFIHDKLEIGFNSRYLLDIITEIDGNEVTLNFSDPAAPVLIVDDAEDNLFFVLMPMRI